MLCGTEEVQRKAATNGAAGQPALLLICGLPGTGKSYLARALAARLPLVVVSSDRVRQLLFSRPVYSAREHGIVHGVCYRLVEQALRQRRAVILDATNLQASTRRRYAALAQKCEATFHVIVMEAAEDTIRARLRRRARGEVDDGSDANETVYDLLRGTVEDVTVPHLSVRGEGDIEPAISRLTMELGLPYTSRSNVS